MKTSTTPKTNTPNSKESSKASLPSSQTAEQTTPIKRFYYRFTAKNHQGLPTFCEGEVNADEFISAGNIIFNELHPKVKDAELELSETPLEPKNKEWIPVNHAVPDDTFSVLAIENLTGISCMAFYEEGEWFDSTSGEPLEITHWQSFPKSLTD